MLEFDLLRAFVAVAECGGFHRAAERLHLTQSTVSQQIKRLEIEAGRPLFRRTTRAVALTDDGEMLLGDARRLLQLEEAARRRLTAPRLSGVVRLGAVEEVAGDSLPPALSRFARLHPNIRLEVTVGVSAELIEQIDAGGLDVVLAKRPWHSSRGRVVWREPLVWAAAESFDLAPDAILPLALFREHSVSREAALDAFRNSERPWHIVYTSPSLTGVRAAALAGLAVTPLPASAVGPGLRILGEPDGLPPLPDLEFAIFEKPRPSPAALALAAVLASLAPSPERTSQVRQRRTGAGPDDAASKPAS
jgi:DNA-binding transcriptional LysR family regulator